MLVRMKRARVGSENGSNASLGVSWAFIFMIAAQALTPTTSWGLDAVAPTVSVSFNPTSISTGGTSALTITLGNANTAMATLTKPLVDSLPAGLTVANATVAGSCMAGAVGAPTGGNGISYATGASIPANGACTIVVNVKATSASGSTYFTDTIAAAALQTSLGNSAGGASATLTVRAATPVPNLIGLSQAAAAAALQAAGLTLGAVTRGPSPTVPYNFVAMESPAAGAAVAAGSAVAIVISTGVNGVANTHNPLASPSVTNPTQVSVAGAVTRVCANLQVPGATLTVTQQHLLANCKAIINTYSGSDNAAGLTNALDAVSGKQSTAQQRTGVEFSGTQFSNIGARLAQLRQGVSGASFADLNMGVPMQGGLGQLLAMLQDGSGTDERGMPVHQVGGGAGDAVSSGSPSRWGFFVNGNILRGSQDSTGEETGFDFRSNGVTAGVDYRFTDKLVFGIAAGHSNGNTIFSDGTGRIDSRSNTGSLYGSYYNDAFYVDAIGTFGHISYDMDRTTEFSINPAAGSAPNCVNGMCTVDTTGETGARQFAVGSSVGYSFHSAGLLFGPDAAINWTHVAVNKFSENDPSQTGLALAYGDQLGESLLLKAGGHFSYAWSTPFAVILPQLRAHYIHEFKNDQRAVQAHYLNDPTVDSATGPISGFSIFTDQPDRNYFDWAAAINAQFRYGISAFVDYSSLGGYSQLQTHEVSFGLRFQYLVP